LGESPAWTRQTNGWPLTGNIADDIVRSVSTRFLLRLPPALHEQLTEQAAQQGVSLNTLIVALLAGGSGFKLDDK
jgi:hypothetical protein